MKELSKHSPCRWKSRIRKELVFTADMPKETVGLVIDVCREYPEVWNVLCGMNSAYCQRGTV